MLAGAFCGVWAAFDSGSLTIGFIGAALGGALLPLPTGMLCLIFRAEQVVSGVVLNILVLGLTTLAIGPIFGADLGGLVRPSNRYHSVSFRTADCRPSAVFTNADCLPRISVGACYLVAFQPHHIWSCLAGRRRGACRGPVHGY